MPGDGNDFAAEFIHQARWEDFPVPVQQRARLCLLDALGAILAGTLAPVSRIASATAVRLWPGDVSTLFLHGRRARAAGAAFANACAANALDIDDDAIFTRGHPGAQLIPTALAVGEEVGASGKAILEALVVGYEIAIRAGRCWHSDHWNYQACGSWGSLGCAAVAARLHGLSLIRTRHALGIADYHAPNAPMMRDVRHPSMVKHATGWGALNGVISAELARRGFTGIPSLLGLDAHREWIMDLGERYWMADWVFYKGWASCAWGHAACQAALELMDQHQFSAQQIAHLRVRTFEEAILLHQGYPTTTEEAQFSVKWPLACLLLDREIGPGQILEHRFGDPAVRELFDKIELILDPAIDAMYKQTQEMDLRMHSAVEIILQDGRKLDSGIVERGADRWNQAMLEDKFRWLLGYVYPADSPVIEQSIERIRSLEDLDQVTELIRPLQPCAADTDRSR